MKNNTEKQEEIKWGGLLNEFLWVCAGVNRKVLRQCPTEYAKYAGTGGTILFTALMAMLSGGYAMYTIFDTTWLAIVFGIFWGLLIFNLDRYIVNTMYSDGEVTISRYEFWGGFPRIIMAIFLGIVISTPLELKIFEDEIQVRIDDMKGDMKKQKVADNEKKVQELTIKLDDIYNEPIAANDLPAKTGEKKIDQLIDDIKNKKKTHASETTTNQNLKVQLRNAKTHADSTNIIAKLHTSNVSLKNLNAEITDLQSELASESDAYRDIIADASALKTQRINALEEQIAELHEKINNVDSAYSELLDKEFGGFQAHMRAFSELKADFPQTRISSIFIMLLFIIVEITPTFFKMMLKSGPYDDMLRAEMHEFRILSDKRISDLNDEVNASVEISTKQNEDRIAAEVLANKELLNTIAEAQAQILSEAIALWKEEELRKVRENPSAYIQSAQESTESLTPNA